MGKLKESYGIDEDVLDAKHREYLSKLDPEDVELYDRFLGNKVI